MDQKIKTAAMKIPLNLIPLRALKGVARVFGYGAKKYAKGNWYSASDDEFGDRYAGGALRHLSDAQNLDGTFNFESLARLDVESGLPEIDHMLCGLIMLRGLMIKRGILAEDPGAGNDPPVKAGVEPTINGTAHQDAERAAEWNVPLSMHRDPEAESRMSTTCPLDF